MTYLSAESFAESVGIRDAGAVVDYCATASSFGSLDGKDAPLAVLPRLARLRANGGVGK